MENRSSEEEFLRQWREETKERTESRAHEVTQLQKRTRVVFWLFIIAATITLIIAVPGIILIFTERLSVGIVAQATGIPGAATVILKFLSKHVQDNMNSVSSSIEEEKKESLAIRMALLIPDNEKKTDAIVSLVAKFRDSLRTVK